MIKVDTYSYKASLALSEFNFNFKLCRLIFLEIRLGSLVQIRYVTGSITNSMKVLYKIENVFMKCSSVRLRGISLCTHILSLKLKTSSGGLIS